MKNPSSITIDYASKITDEHIVFENPIFEIQNSAFANRSDIKSVTFLGNTENVGKYAFTNCTNLETVMFKDYVHIIHQRAFENSLKLKNLSFEKIGSVDFAAFQNCAISFVDADNIKRIGQYAFAKNNIEYIFLTNPKRIFEGTFAFNPIKKVSVALDKDEKDARLENYSFVNPDNVIDIVDFSAPIFLLTAFNQCKIRTLVLNTEKLSNFYYWSYDEDRPEIETIIFSAPPSAKLEAMPAFYSFITDYDKNIISNPTMDELLKRFSLSEANDLFKHKLSERKFDLIPSIR